MVVDAFRRINVGALQLAILAQQLFQAPPLVGRHADPLAPITLSLAHALAQRLGRAVQFPGDRSIAAHCNGYAGRALAQAGSRALDFQENPTRLCHGRILSRNSPSEKAGTIH